MPRTRESLPASAVIAHTRRAYFPRALIRVALLALLLLASAAAFAESDAPNQSAPTPRKPNFIIFLVDDMGWIDPACYGHPFHETPNIDRLARQGMRFTDAYAACPVCSPTRASILTGRYPAHLNLTDFIPGHRYPWARLTVPEMHPHLPLEEVTLAELLKSAGYVSAAFGKWHLGPASHYPRQQGFDESLVTSGRHFAPRFRTQPPLEVADGAWLGDVLTDRAEQFLDTYRDEPFVLYLAHYAVHIPLEAPAETVAKYEAKQPKPPGHVNNPAYAAMVEHVDRSLGRIMQKLDDLELSDDTLLIFFSDNGGLYQSASRNDSPVMKNTPLRDEKGTLYEGGIRVPCIIRWPGRVPAGTLCDVPVCSVDLLPTLADFAGLADRLPPNVDGVSLRPLLAGSGRLEREALYWHYPHYHHSTPAGAIRMGDFKLIEFFEDGRTELYNLRDDLSETNNLAARMPHKSQELHQHLTRWRQTVNARMPTPNPAHDPQRANEMKRRRR